MKFEELVEALSNASGAALDNSDGAIGLEVGGMGFFVLNVVPPGQGEYLVVAADLGEVPPERPEKLYQAMLEAGYRYQGAAGGTFARNPEDGHIWLQWYEQVSALTVESAMEAIKSLGDAAVKWRDVIKDYREGSELPSMMPSDAVGERDISGFISV